MRSLLLLLVLKGSVAVAEPNGPPRPVAVAASPAQAAMVNYRQNYQAASPTKPCARSNAAEVVVCAESGRGGSPNRLPLPDERGSSGVRIATGEPPHLGVGGAPFHHEVAGTGLTVTIKPGDTRLKGNGAQ